MAGKSKNFLVDTRVTYSVLTSYSGAFSSQTILGVTGKTITKKFTQALLCCWDGQIFSHQFLVIPDCPTSFLERYLSLRNLDAIAVQIEDALKLSFGGKLTIFTSHQVKQLLNGRGHLWMFDQRLLIYQVVLMENPGLTISPCEVLNPATLLLTSEVSLPFHSCVETLDHWTIP